MSRISSIVHNKGNMLASQEEDENMLEHGQRGLLPDTGPSHIAISGFNYPWGQNGIYQRCDDDDVNGRARYEKVTMGNMKYVMEYDPRLDCYTTRDPVRSREGNWVTKLPWLTHASQLDNINEDEEDEYEEDEEYEEELGDSTKKGSRRTCEARWCCRRFPVSGDVSKYDGAVHDRDALCEESEKLECAESSSFGRWLMVRISLVVFALVLVASAVFLYFELPRHIKVQSETRRQYIDSRGIGILLVTIAVASIPAGIAASGMVAKSDDQLVTEWLTSGNVLPSIELRQDAGLSQEGRVKDVFLPDALMYFKFAVLIALTSLNCYSIHDRFIHLPNRDPGERMNLARHIVGWFEEIAMVSVLFWILLCAVGMAVTDFRYQRGNMEFYRKRLVTLGASHDDVSQTKLMNSTKAACINNIFAIVRVLKSASVLQFLRSLNTTDIITGCKTSYQWGSKFHKVCGVFCTFCSFALKVIAGGLGAMALCIKINSVDFVTEVLVDDYTVWDMITLAGLVNQVVGIYDTGKIRIDAMMHALCRSPSDPEMQARRVAKLRNFLITALLGCFGWADVVVIMLTIESDKLESLIMKID